MDSDVASALTSLSTTVKGDAIDTYAYVLPLAFGIFVAIWAIRFGYGKLVKGLKGRA